MKWSLQISLDAQGRVATLYESKTADMSPTFRTLACPGVPSNRSPVTACKGANAILQASFDFDLRKNFEPAVEARCWAVFGGPGGGGGGLNVSGTRFGLWPSDLCVAGCTEGGSHPCLIELIKVFVFMISYVLSTAVIQSELSRKASNFNLQLLAACHLFSRQSSTISHPGIDIAL